MQNMSSLVPSNNIDTTILSGRRKNNNKPSLPKCPQPFRYRRAFKAFSTTVAVSSAAAIAVHCNKPIIINNGHGGVGGGGGNFGGGGGWWFGGGGNGGGFWSRFFTPAAAIADETKSEEFDSHGMPVNITVQLNKLSGFKKYKISEIMFFDKRRKTKVSSDDSFSEMITIVPGGVYTRAQLQKELDSLASSGMFEKVDLEGKTNADGTVGITVSYSESTWEAAEKFRCINVGMMPQTKPIEFDSDMTEKERMKQYLSQEREYKRRMEKARPCILPREVNLEIMDMMRKERSLSARLLQKIRDRVQNWYHDQGYACAQVVNFGNLNTKEVVCEVVEGDISQLQVKFIDKLGNVVEGNTQTPVIHRELPKEV